MGDESPCISTPAIASYRDLMQILWKIYDRTGIDAALNNQSITSLQVRDYRKAVEFCHGAIAIFRTLDDLRREAAALNNMGIAYEKLDDSNDYLLLRQHERSLAMIFSGTSL